MRQSTTISMIKATARDRLIGRYGTTIGAAILLLLIQVLVSDAVIIMVSPDNIITYIVYLFTVLLVDVLFGVFYSGVAYLYMNVVYAQPARTSDIFHGFKMHPDKALMIQVPFALASFVQTVPISIMRNFLRGQEGSSIYMAMIGLTLVGTIMSIIVKLIYAQSFYLLQDFPDKSAGEILGISARIMKGNKWRLVKMYLSFIPIIILGALTLFLPLLWVDSYIEASRAAFYQDCIVSANRNS